jgi:hypothetical protein
MGAKRCHDDGNARMGEAWNRLWQSTQADGKNSHISTINAHRLNVGGYRYRVLRMSPNDVSARGLQPGMPKAR